MDYALSAEQFLHGKMFDSKGQFSHKTGNRFKLFPFVTHPNSEPVLELNNLIGALLCRIEGEKPEEITADMLITSLKEIDDTEIEQGQEDKFAEVIKILFFDDNGNYSAPTLSRTKAHLSGISNGIPFLMHFTCYR